MNESSILPSWRPGATRDAVVEFLAAAASVPVAERVACFDNDGTLWCERPSYVQLDFYIEALRRRAAEDASLVERRELAAVLAGDRVAIAEIGLPRVALALAGLFEGMTPRDFDAAARGFMAAARHPTLDRPTRATVYQPMLELLDELRRMEFTIAIVTGGGTEFVRAISTDLYGVPPELVVGSMIAYEFARDAADRPVLRRTGEILGAFNEGTAKVVHIQSQLGRHPIVAGGNSAGDREMLEWAAAHDGPSLAILIDHDDADREFAYVSEAAAVTECEPITVVGRQLGWTVVSVERDWRCVFPPLG